MSVENFILAVVTTQDKRDRVSGGAPVFLADDEAGLERLCLLLARVLKGMTHDLENGVYVIVKH